MIKYIDVKTGEVIGEYPPSREKTIFVVIDREAYEYLEQVKSDLAKWSSWSKTYEAMCKTKGGPE